MVILVNVASYYVASTVLIPATTLDKRVHVSMHAVVNVRTWW